MTDRIAALAVICDGEASERTAILSDFAQKFQENELVMDKWFAVQAMAARHGTLSEVERLMSHPQFNLKNPNRARSLLASSPLAIYGVSMPKMALAINFYANKSPRLTNSTRAWPPAWLRP